MRYTCKQGRLQLGDGGPLTNHQQCKGHDGTRGQYSVQVQHAQAGRPLRGSQSLMQAAAATQGLRMGKAQGYSDATGKAARRAGCEQTIKHTTGERNKQGMPRGRHPTQGSPGPPPRGGPARSQPYLAEPQPAHPAWVAGASNEPNHSQGGRRLPPLPQHGGHRRHADQRCGSLDNGNECALWGAN